MSLATEPGGPIIVVDHDELDALAEALAERAAAAIREHLHVEPSDADWCPRCQTEGHSPGSSAAAEAHRAQREAGPPETERELAERWVHQGHDPSPHQGHDPSPHQGHDPSPSETS